MTTHIVAITAMVALTGCCAVTRTLPDGTKVNAVVWSISPRTITVDRNGAVKVLVTDTAESLRATGQLAGEAAKAAGYGGPR